jgi:hypothetical protein
VEEESTAWIRNQNKPDHRVPVNDLEKVMGVDDEDERIRRRRKQNKRNKNQNVKALRLLFLVYRNRFRSAPSATNP